MIVFFYMFLSFFSGCSPTHRVHQSVTADMYAQFSLRTYETIQCSLYSEFVYQAVKKTSHIEPLEHFVKNADKKRDVMTQLYEYQNHSDPILRQMARDVRKLETVVAMSCPSILKRIPYENIAWKHPNISEFLKEHVPQFAPSPITLNSQQELIDEKTQKSFDYVIVGSGISGSMIAHQLWNAGKRVLLLDAGHFSIPGAFDTRQMSDLRIENGGIPSQDRLIAFESAQAVGGGGTINADLIFSPTSDLVQKRIQHWKEQGWIEDSKWNFEDLERADQAVRDLIGTRILEETEINANNFVLWEGTNKIGYEAKMYDLNRYQRDQSPSPISAKKSPIETLIYPALVDGNNTLGLLPRAYVSHVEFDNSEHPKKAISVVVEMLPPKTTHGYLDTFHQKKFKEGQKIRIPANNIILSAGSIGSALILQNSDINNPNIGRGFVGHISYPVLGIFEHEIQANRGTTASVFVDDFADEGFLLESMSANSPYIAAILPGNNSFVAQTALQMDRMAGFGVMVVDDVNVENSISQKEAKEHNKNTLIMDYTLSEIDKEKMRRGMIRSVEILFAAGAQKVLLPTSETIDGMEIFEIEIDSSMETTKETLQNLQFLPGNHTLISAHIMSSNKMGTDPQNSVVQNNHLVWGTENLYVIDSSILPASPSVNPMQTLYSIAYLAVEDILAEE